MAPEYFEYRFSMIIFISFLLLKFITIQQKTQKTTTNFMILLIEDFLADDPDGSIINPTLADFIFLI